MVFQHIPVRRWSSVVICWLRPNCLSVHSEMQHVRTLRLRVRHVAVRAPAAAASSGRAAVKMALITPGGISARPARAHRVVCIASCSSCTSVRVEPAIWMHTLASDEHYSCMLTQHDGNAIRLTQQRPSAKQGMLSCTACNSRDTYFLQMRQQQDRSSCTCNAGHVTINRCSLICHYCNCHA